MLTEHWSCLLITTSHAGPAQNTCIGWPMLGMSACTARNKTSSLQWAQIYVRFACNVLLPWYQLSFILRVLDENPGPSGTYPCYFAQSWNGASCEGTSTLNPPVLIHKVNVPVFITCRGAGWHSLVSRCMGTRLGLTDSKWALQEGRRQGRHTA